MSTEYDQHQLIDRIERKIWDLNGRRATLGIDIVIIGPVDKHGPTMSRAVRFLRPPEDFLAELPLTYALGFPLLMLRPADLGLATPPVGLNTINTNVIVLGTIFDPTSAELGKSTFKGPIIGDFLVMRPDGQELVHEQVLTLLMYCTKIISAFEKVVKEEAGVAVVDRAATVAKLVAPEAFAAYFEQRKRAGLEKGGDRAEEWKDVECPIKLA